MSAGDSYGKLAQTIVISINRHALFAESTWFSSYRLQETTTHRELTPLLELHYAESSKFHQDRAADLTDPASCWIHNLKYSDFYLSSDPEVEIDVPQPLKDQEGITMAPHSMNRAYAHSEVRELMLAREKAHRDEISRIEYALESGREQGLQQGLQQAARAMLADGMGWDRVAELTGLSAPPPPLV